MQHDEQDKVKHASPLPKPATPAQVPAAHPAMSPTHQPVWTEAMDAPKQVRHWLDVNISIVHSLSLQDLVRRVRKHVPEATKLADSEIQHVIRQWAKDHSIVVPTVSTFPEAN